jgi:hypothetical protein
MLRLIFAELVSGTGARQSLLNVSGTALAAGSECKSRQAPAASAIPLSESVVIPVLHFLKQVSPCLS